MVDFINALRDPQFRADYLRGLKDAGNRSAAAFFGGPVDFATMAMRPFGYSTQDSDVIGGSEWIGRKMEENGMVSEARNPIAEFLASLALPGMVASQAPRIFAAEQSAIKNAMAPKSLSKQAGMIKIDGRGQIPETRSDVNKLADRFQRLLDDAGVSYTHDKSGLSPARYFEFDNPQTLTNEYGPDRFKVRISDHRNIHGADISVDPSTGGTFEEMIQSVRDIGVPVANKVRPASKAIVPDEVLEKMWGAPISNIPDKWVDLQRKNLIFDKNKGYWRQK